MGVCVVGITEKSEMVQFVARAAPWSLLCHKLAVPSEQESRGLSQVPFRQALVLERKKGTFPV
jgi:hypothetical protein